MKAKTRLLWMKLHAYLACFFLPITLVYIVSGVLYLFDIKGGVKSEMELTITLPGQWPIEREQAEQLIRPVLEQHQLPSLPEDYYPQDALLEWYGYQQNVLLSPVAETPAGDSGDQRAQLAIKQHDFIHQLLLIHKGFGGYLFFLLAVGLGLSLTFSLISGLVISLQMPQIKIPSLLSLALGVALLTGMFVT